MRLATDIEVEQGVKVHRRVVISGYYGFNNLGDELILQVLIEHLKEQDVQVTVLSNDPVRTAAELGVQAIHRTNIIDIIDALSQAHLFISGGGGLFQDATGPMSAVYYGGLIHAARYFEVPVCFWAQGVGPLKGSWSRKITASALKQCKAITVRDLDSALLVEQLTGIQAEITGDPVWLLKMPKKKRALGKRKKGKDKTTEQWTIGISLRPWHLLTDERLEAFADFLSALVKDSMRPVHFLLFPFQPLDDGPLLTDLGDLLNARNAGTHEMVAETDVVKRMGECNVLFGMRLHSLVLGILNDVAIYGLVYDPKVEALLSYFRLLGTDIEEIETMNPSDIQHYFNHYPAVDLELLQQNARRNFEVLHDLLDLKVTELIM